MMIDLDLLVVWLNAVPTTVEYSFVKGPREPEYGVADNVGVVTPLEGPGLDLEGVGSVASFQIKVTGREFEHDKIRKTAFELDSALLFGAPADAWGTWIQYVDRTGGEPAVLQEDEFDRIAYVCSYIAHETREI